MFKGSLKYVAGLTKAFKMQYISAGFMEMMFLDPISFDQQHYDFSYVRRDFLGAVRTLVFDVHPKPGTGSGRFTGRIWVEDQNGNIVRFNGTYTGGNQDDDSSNYFHFDSWRENLQPGLWLPVGVYVEETQKSSEHPVSFKAQTYIWGYSLKVPTHESDNESIKIDDVQDQSDQNQDLSPLQAQRQWITQAEENVLDRLVQAGLLAPPSDFDKILEQVANNIVIGNNIQLSDTIRCRVLLTAPLESLAVGNTIILSKGLIDVLPSRLIWLRSSPSSWLTSSLVTTSTRGTRLTIVFCSPTKQPLSGFTCPIRIQTTNWRPRRRSNCSTIPFMPTSSRSRVCSCRNWMRARNSLRRSIRRDWAIRCCVPPANPG